MAARIAMMAITTSSSIRVKPDFLSFISTFPSQELRAYDREHHRELLAAAGSRCLPRDQVTGKNNRLRSGSATLSVDPFLEKAQGLFRHALQRLAHRSQRGRNFRYGARIIEAHDGKLVGNRDTGLSRDFNNRARDHRACREDGGGAVGLLQ